MLLTSYFIINNKNKKEIINSKNILKIDFVENTLGTGTYLNSVYCISEDKKTVIIKTKVFSEKTGKSTDEKISKKIEKSIIEAFIKKLEKNINKNAFEIEYKQTQFGKVPNIKYPLYNINYKGQETYVQAGQAFYKQAEKFLEKTNKK